MYSTILLTLDGSKRAEAILPHVEAAAYRYEAWMVFLRVISPIPHVTIPYANHYEL